MLLDVSERAEESFLFAAPQRDANRAPRPHADRLQDPRRLHHHRAADRVVGGACRRVPRVEVSAEHDDLVLLVRARDLRDRVVRRVPLRIRPVDDVEFEAHRRAIGEDPRDAAVVLVAHDDGGHGLRDVVRAVVERDDLAVRAAGVVDARGRLVLDEERVHALVNLARREAAVGRLLTASAAAALTEAAPTPLARGILVGVGGVAASRVDVGEPRLRRVEVDRNEDRLADEDRGVPHLVFDAVQVRVQFFRRRTEPLRPAAPGALSRGRGRFGTLRRHEIERRRRDGAVRPRRPRERLDDERVLHGRDDVHLEVIVRPARVAELPRLQPSVREAPRFHLLHRPFGRGLVGRRAGEPRPVDVGQEVERAHDPGMRRLFLADLRVDVGVDLFLGGERQRRRRKRDDGGGCECACAHGAELYGMTDGARLRSRAAAGELRRGPAEAASRQRRGMRDARCGIRDAESARD